MSGQIEIRKSHGFTAISNYHLNDKRLSFQAKGMLTVLLAYPIGTHISVNLLIENSTNGRDSVYSILKKLQKLGYIEKFQSKSQQDFGRVKYVVYEIPQGKKAKKGSEKPMESALTDFPEAPNENPEKNNGSETHIKSALTENTEAPNSSEMPIKPALTENPEAYTNNKSYSLFDKKHKNLELPNFNEEIFERNKKCLKSDAVHMNVNSYLKIENLNLKNDYDSYVDRFMIKMKATGEYNFHINKLQPYFINWLKIEAKTEVMPKVFSKSYNDWKNQESSKPRNYIN